MALDHLLIDLGVNISANVIYDVVKSYFAKESSPTREGLKSTISASLDIKNASIKAENIINFLAENGDIVISGSQIYASKSIMMASSKDTRFVFGNNSESKTDKSSIVAGHGAQIIGRRGAKIIQDEEGNISFYA